MVFITILFLGILYLSKYIQNKNLLFIISKNSVYYISLLFLIVYGYYYGLDYSERFGCVIWNSPNIDFKSFLFSTISFSLILVSFLFKNRKIKLMFLFLELFFWLFKLFYLKGGYVVGIAASYSFKILLFDSITLLLRFLILNSLFKVRFSNLKLIVSVLLLMSIKVYVFPIQFVIIHEKINSKKRSIETSSKIIGNWNGILKTNDLNENDVSLTSFIELKIDSNFVYFKNENNKLNKIEIYFESEFSGRIIDCENLFDNLNPYFYIFNLTTDSLEFEILHDFTDYKFSLERQD